jgi:twinkle protein
MNTNASFKGQAQRLYKRGISEATCEYYKVYRDGELLRFPYYSSSGSLQGFKTKNKLKEFKYEGITTDTLFGQHLFPSSGTRITIYEGELDAMSGWEALPNWAHVSLPHGAASAKKDLRKQISYLQGYDEICLFFDNDEAGQKAAKEAASILPAGKVTIAKLAEYKDASDALQKLDTTSIRNAIYNADRYQPDGIVDAKTLLEVVTTPNAPCDHEYKLKGLQKLTHGMRSSELTTITAGTGQGKSTFCRQLAVDLLNDGVKVGYIALEESNRRTALGLMSVATSQALHIGEHDTQTLKDAYDRSLAIWDLHLHDHFGSLDPDVIYSRCEYMALGLETKVIFIDHLSILLSGLDGDERKCIDKTMTNLRSLVQRTGISLYLVSHLRRTGVGSTSAEEGGRVSLSALRGSHSISQISDNVWGLEANQQAEGDRSTVLRVLKNRYTGDVGVASNLTYNKETCIFEEDSESFNPSTDF